MTIRIALISTAAAVLLGTALSGCDVGNENPISPQQMEDIRQKEANDRANFNPEMPSRQ